MTQETVTVLKLDHNGKEVVRYSAELLHQTPTTITVRAVFVHPTKDTGYTIFRTGDHLNEHFYTDRWYNVFALYDGDRSTLKGWYCNICRPAKLEDGFLHCEDLALDVWVFPDGEVTMLDEEEFSQLNLTAAEKKASKNAVNAIRQMAANVTLPR